MVVDDLRGWVPRSLPGVTTTIPSHRMHSLKSYSPKRASMFRPKEDLPNRIHDRKPRRKCDPVCQMQRQLDNGHRYQNLRVISFNVTKTKQRKREAIIEVSYADIQPAPSFKVKQTFRMHSLKSYLPKRASMFRPKEDLSKSNTRSKTPSQMRPCLPNATTVG